MDPNNTQIKFDNIALQSNFSAILYLLTEQQALIGKLLRALLDTNKLSLSQLRCITDTEEGEEGLVPTYTQLYKRFAIYYLRTKELLESEDAPEEFLVETLTKQDE